MKNITEYTTIEVILLLACGDDLRLNVLPYNVKYTIAFNISRFKPVTEFFRFMQPIALEYILDEL